MRGNSMASIDENAEALGLSMFKAYDIRTRASRLTPEKARRLMAAVGGYIKDSLKADEVVLGRDARLAAPALMQEAIDLFPAMGISVLLNPLQESTCQFYFSCMRNPGAASVMVTASHNPGDYIGLKIQGPGMLPIAMGFGPGAGLAEIRSRYIEGGRAPAPTPLRGRVRVRRYLDEYLDYSLRLAGLEAGALSGAPLLVDFLCGAAGTEIAEALDCAGAKVETRHLVPDGGFPAGDPNPLVPQSILSSRMEMARGGYLCGFCFDGDGDRMDVMDSGGEQLAPSFNLTAILPDILAAFRASGAARASGAGGSLLKPHLFSDVKANPLAMADQAACGVGVHIIRNGHSFIKGALRARASEGYLLASEESAHYYMNFPADPGDWSKGQYATENTLYFTLMTASAWVRHPERFARALARQATLAREREWACHFRDEGAMEETLAEVEAEFARRGLAVLRTMEDGSDLDATLMRSGLPETIDAATDLSKPWYQVAQRVSRSEEGMARWEIVSNSRRACDEAVAAVRAITDRRVESGLADYE